MSEARITETRNASLVALKKIAKLERDGIQNKADIAELKAQVVALKQANDELTARIDRAGQ